MDRQIENMVSNDAELAEVIIEGKGKVKNEAPGQKAPDIRDVVDVPYGRIIDNGALIIKVERTMKGVRIDNKPQANNEDDRK